MLALLALTLLAQPRLPASDPPVALDDGVGLVRQAPPTPWPPVFHAEVVKAGAPLKKVDDGATNGVASPDGRSVVYFARGQAQALELKRGSKPRALGTAAGWLAPSPDGRYVVSPGSPLQRDPLSAKDGRITLARGESLNALTGLAIGRTHFGFISGSGRLVVASLDEGTPRTLVVDAPKSSGCHVGDGFPRDFSADGQWLFFQSGCEKHGAAKVDGSAVKYFEFDGAKVVGQFVVGSKANGPIQVGSLDRDEQWTIPDSTLAPFPFVVALNGRPAFVQANHDALELVDLKAKTVRTVLTKGDVGPVSPFLQPSSDGRRVLALRQGPTSCELHLVDLESQAKSRKLAFVEGARMCEARWAGPSRAVLLVSGAQGGVVADIDLTTLALRTHEAGPGFIAASADEAVVINGDVLVLPFD